MRVFLHAQQRGLKLHPDLAQVIRNELSLVDREFLNDKHVHETFLEILNQRGNVAPILRSMHEVGFLGKYLPEFGKLTCLVQHEFYHQYTARTSKALICLAQLDRVWDAKAPPFNGYTEMLQGLDRPFLLYLALLLHDAGKALPRPNHAQVGGLIAAGVAKRIELDGATTHSLRLVIENHLAMAQISQRRDLEDPAVIRGFAQQIQSAENLVMLTLHTFADSQGTSTQLWNSFKDSLLLTLFRKTLGLFEGGTDFQRAEAKQTELLADEVKNMFPATFSPEELQAHFSHLPQRYFRIHTARQIMSDISLAHRFMHLQLDEDKAFEPVITWHNEPDRGYTSVHVCTWDLPGLFSKIAGSLSAAGLNILSAQIFTRTDGIILDTFFVADARTGLLAKREEKEKFENLLRRALAGEMDFASLIGVDGKTPIYRSVDGERITTVITFDNEISDSYTVIDIETEDRVGLLFIISQTLSEVGLDIALAKIVTEKGAAIDTFYVTTREKQKISDTQYLHHIEQKLYEAIHQLAPAP